MKLKLLEAGIVVNTHGVRGEIKIQPWADTPGFLTGFRQLYIDGAPLKVLSARVHKGCVITALEGVADVKSAALLKSKIVSISREETHPGEDRHFIADLLGLRAIDADTGADLGVIADIMKIPSGEIYVIKGAREILVPAVSEFVREVDTERGCIKFRLIEGM